MTVKSSTRKGKEGAITTVGDVRKEDTKKFMVNAIDGSPDDAFSGDYWNGKDKDNGLKPAVIEPTYKPGQLYTLTVQNNTLSQCIEVMEVNVDGTGHSIDLISEATENEAEKTMLENFFAEPYPEKSMIEIRRARRRDLETTGCAYIEVIRNPANEVVLINHLEALNMRLIRYDEPVSVTRTIMRNGKDITVSMQARERRFVQDINGTKTYFKQFGASRDLNRKTGEWSPKGQTLPADQRATEVLYSIGNKEPKTPYGTPRWINQLPSVLGSRKAEEHNLQFFDSGGLPPVLVMIQGGTLGDTVREQLIAHLSGKGNSHRAAVVEAVSTSGSLDSAGSVQVKVERFGAERMQDAMFMDYDSNTEEHVRTSFRLPPLFTGKASDYSFATAYASYLVAEAQVFWPEREEFDSLINNTVVKALGAKSYKFRSLPLTIVDIENQMKALELVKGTMVDGEHFIEKLNEVVGLGLEYQEQKEPEPPVGKTDPLTGLPYKEPVPPVHPATVSPMKNKAGVGNGDTRGNKGLALKSDLGHDVKAMALAWLEMAGITPATTVWSTDDRQELFHTIKSLSAEEAEAFNSYMASESIEKLEIDHDGLSELCGCASHLVTVNDN